MNCDLGYGSHHPILALAVHRTTGPVIECGMGDSSTHLLHYMCLGRKLFSCETDQAWLEKYLEYRTADHQLIHVGKWGEVGMIDTDRFDVAFIDSSPGEERIDLVKRLKGHCKFIVAHDLEADIRPAGGNYQWAQLDGLFKYYTLFDKLRPWTGVWSDEEKFTL